MAVKYLFATFTPNWSSDNWADYERVLPPEVNHHISKSRIQPLERTNESKAATDGTISPTTE